MGRSNTDCESGESRKCAEHNATERRVWATGSLRLCVPCAQRFDEVTCQHDEPREACSTCAEAAYEDSLSAFYGSSSPQTDAERADAAWRQKRGLQ